MGYEDKAVFHLIIQSVMWLNIDYYVKDENKRKELMEMIKVSESQEQDFFKWQEEFGNSREEIGREEGREEERNEIIKKLLRVKTPEEISEILEIPLKEIELLSK